jgi:Kef-type K+ transport system membrane component KefB
MAKYIFGLGSSQMALSTVVGAAVAVACGMAIPPAVIIGLGLAFSSTAVALQVLADRGESATRHGRATFSVLLFQDLTVVLVFMLVPLLAGPDSGSLAAIGGSLLKAVVKTAAAIVSIIGLGRVVLRPVFNRVAKLRQAELLSATTLFVALGTSLLTQSLGLSMALGAFLAGLLLAETEFHLQVENDIAPFRGLLLGLFFMTVGMTINPMTFQQSAANIVSMMAAILVGKIAVVCAVGPLFGLSLLNCLRAALYIGPGGEFAFVTFAEAVRVGLFNAELATQLNLAVVLTMAITPYLAELGNKMKDVLSTGNVATLQPKESEVDDLKGHVILAGYGRQGKIIGEILAENMIPFVALDVNPEIVSESRAKDQNVYFGDAGSPEVLKAVGADRASCAIVALSSPGANYRAVWTLNKNFNNVQTYVRARDVEGGLILEKAGAKAVVPEQLEPALQLAAACLREQKMAPNDITVAIDSYRRSHVKALQSSIKFSADYSTVDYGAMGRSIDQSMDVSSDEPGEVVIA